MSKQEIVVPKNELTESKIMQALDWAYDKAVNGGIPGTDTVEELARSYIKTGKSLIDQANDLIFWQNSKSATSGFLSGLGGVVILPLTLPANFTSVIFIQIRMIAAIAYLGGHDIKDDKVKSLVYMCLCGNGIKDIMKNAGVQVGTKLTKTVIQKYLTREIINKINKFVGFRLLTKAGEKGVINAMKLVPVVGGIIGGATDLAATNIIGNTARKIFIEENINI